MSSRVFTLLLVSLFAFACKPTEHQQKLIADIQKSLVAMTQEIPKFEGDAEYLSKEQAKFDSVNAALKKERKGKADSVYNALAREHRKIVDAHAEHLEKAKTALDAMKSLLEKLNQPVNFTYSAELIEADYTTFDVMYAEAKPTLESSIEEHKKIEQALEARLKEIETEKSATAIAPEPSKSAATKPEKKRRK